MAGLNCPECEGSTVQRISLAHAAGTSKIEANLSGASFSRRGNSAFFGQLAGNQQTLLAASCQPPKMLSGEANGCLLFLLIVLCVAAAILVGPFGGSAIFLILAVGKSIQSSKRSVWNRRTYPVVYDDWQQNFVCLSCGHTFKPLFERPRAPETNSARLYTVTIARYGNEKAKAIKVVRNLTGASFREANDMLGRLPCLLRANLTPAEVTKIHYDLLKCGADIDCQEAPWKYS